MKKYFIASCICMTTLVFALLIKQQIGFLTDFSCGFLTASGFYLGLKIND